MLVIRVAGLALHAVDSQRGLGNSVTWAMSRHSGCLSPHQRGKVLASEGIGYLMGQNPKRAGDSSCIALQHWVEREVLVWLLVRVQLDGCE